MHVDDVRGDAGVVAPEFTRDLLAGVDAAGGAGEHAEQVELAWGEADLVVGEGAHPLVAFELEEAHRDAGGAVAMAELHADAGDELVRVEGFGDVVVGAHAEEADLLLGIVDGGEDEDGHVVRGADAAGDLVTAEVGQAEVDEDEVGGVLARLDEAAGAVVGLQGAEAGVLEGQLDEVGDVVVVLDDQDGRCVHDGLLVWK